MENQEIEILYIEDSTKDAEEGKDIFKKNKLGDKFIYLRNGAEANDFIFGTGQFSGRNIYNKPKRIVFNMNMMKAHDMEFYNKIKVNELTKDIPLFIITVKTEEEKKIIDNDHIFKGAMLLGLFDLSSI